MTLTAPEVAERFGGSRPGFELVAVEEVGLPYFRLSLEAVVQERSPLPTVDEFVLRAVASGLSKFEDVTGFLGLEGVLVEQAVVGQSHQDHLDYQWDPITDQRRLRLTPQGQNALENATFRRERKEIDIGFDRLLWAPTGRRLSQLIRPRQASDAGLLEIPPLYKKRLSTFDLDTDSAKRAIYELSVRALQEIEVLALTNVTNNRFLLPAIALVYVANDGSSTQVAFAIDGRISSEHERAFAEMNGPERCGLVVESRPKGAGRLSIPARLTERALSREQVQMLRKRGADLERDLEDTRTATAALEGERNSMPFTTNEDELLDAVTQLASEIDSSPVRAIQTYEHRELLSSALANSKQRLLIMSPAIRSGVVDANFIARLERLCRNRVSLQIGWGVSPDDEAEQSDPEALESLRSLSGKYQNFSFKFVGDASPTLLWDSSMVVTSFGWLSFRGDRNRRYRQEAGVLIRDVGYVDQQYSILRQQIEAASDRNLLS
ncbi:hypothetical protein [Mycobacterium kansasii]|uniref:hypothetical protein n=1 Tax=Mycobacterium kansasii TaxID=1768 RepID=UPI000F1EDA8C|nr:hypothetical protein [Mycobacterium kansasii]VAZ63161.1 hypothetical protein LAUMK22_04993 [Mycobacterium kansasii]